MRIENGYLQQSMLCSKNNRNAVGNFSDTMNKAQECISNKISTRDSYVNSTDYSNFGIYTKNSISQDVELPIETERYKIEDSGSSLIFSRYFSFSSYGFSNRFARNEVTNPLSLQFTYFPNFISTHTFGAP